MSGTPTLARERVESSSTDLLFGRTARLPWLDVLRGVAVILVMLRHAWPTAFPAAGIVGVTMFFALSGYLITGLIVRDLDSRGRLRWGRFYAHRFMRLYPALLLLVCVFVVVELVWDPVGSRDRLAASVAIALTYLADLPFADVLSGSITHLWSLAVEEQFYLVWPAFLLLGFVWIGKRNLARWVGGAAIALTGICWFMALQIPAIDMYELPTTWASSMAIGALIYLLRDRLSFVRGRTAWAAASALVLLALCFVPNAKEMTATYFVMPGLIALATGVVILSLENAALPRPAVLHAAGRLLASIGVVSYAVYLWNLPIATWWNAAVALPAWGDVATIPLTLGAAIVSWYSVEAIGRAGRARYDRRAARKNVLASV